MFFDDALSSLQKVCIYPATVRVECNDKVTKSVFSRTSEQYHNMINGVPAGVIEKKNHKQNGKLVTSYTFQNASGYGNLIPLDEFDRAVLSVCISEFLAGNRYSTPAIIFRSLIGKTGQVGVDPTKKQVAMIEDSIDKLMFTQFDSDAAKAIEELRYINDGDELFLEKSAVLPCYRVKAIIGGHIIKAIFFDRESPHWLIANQKNQVLRYHSNLLYTGDHYNSRHKIAVTNYVLRRAIEIVYHKNLTPFITFDDVFSKCRVDDLSRKIKSNLRDNILVIFQNLKNANIISDFSTVKNSVTYRGIKVDRKS